MARRLVAVCLAVVLLVAPRAAYAWIDNHVLGDEITITVDESGKALVEHRILLHTNGNVRFRKYAIVGVDRDAVPLENSYVVPAREALSNTLETATPLSLTLVHPPSEEGDAPPARLDIAVDDEKGLRRGSYLLVLRYRTDLVATGRVRRDGAFVRITWTGPIFDDGFDNARTTFVLPKAPTPPRAVDDVDGEGSASAEEDDTPTSLTELRRGEAVDEFELLRTYAAKGEAVSWAVRIDPRALTTANPAAESGPSVDSRPASSSPVAEEALPVHLRGEARLWVAALLFLISGLLVWGKSREVRRLASEANAEMPALIPLPGWLRGLLAGAALTFGLALQLMRGEALAGAISIVLAAALTIYRPARLNPKSTLRGPGRWLAVSEGEALRNLPRPTGGWLDCSTWRGKALLCTALVGVGICAWRLTLHSMWHGALLGADAVFLIALFGTGMGRALPPDMTVEPARFLAKVLRRLRAREDLADVRIVPRIRIPAGEVDADEVRLLLAPRSPLRGFTGIEVGLTYAVGMGARVAMPEVLVRVIAGSPCDQAVGAISRVGRVAPGRKRDERTISLAPRFPTVRMTAEIAAAVAIRVIDREVRAARKAARTAEAKKKAA